MMRTNADIGVHYIKIRKYGVGTKHLTNEGYEIEIIEKMGHGKRRVRFENGHEVICERTNIGTGHIRNPYHPSVQGIGYLGIGNYKSNAKGKSTPEYEVWNMMLQRCYSEKHQEKFPTYKGTIVCKEWHNFQSFAKWYHDNYPNINEVNFQLDKDLLQNDVKNKIYSPQTCIFLPKNVNSFLTNKKSDNTSGYIGVSWFKASIKWVANINLFGENKLKHLGYFLTPEEASETYQSARELEAEKVKEYLRSLNYLSEEIIKLVK